MTIKKSYYNILKYLVGNTVRKATLSFTLGTSDTSICYLPEMGLYIDFYESHNKYIFHQMRMCPTFLDRKAKHLWEIEELTNLDQKAIQEYIKSNGSCEVVYKEDLA